MRWGIETILPNGLRVSSVEFGGDYESMLFDKDSLVDLDCFRYSSKEEAIVGHEAMIRKYDRDMSELVFVF